MYSPTEPAAPAEGVDYRLSLWTSLATGWGFEDFVSPEDGFRTCLKAGTRWAHSGVPGIYFWIAEDGEAYVGQSVNPQSRLREHWKNHPDILRACFMPCDRERLDRLESKLIEKAEKHFPLRNIKLAVSTSREVPFDKIVSAAEQEAFCRGEQLHDRPWRDWELLTRLQRRKFERFARSGAEALELLQLYVSRSIPRPAATEVAFWSATLFPDKKFLRVNAGQQEVFTVGKVGNEWEVRVLSDRRASLLRSRKARYATPSFIDIMPSCRLHPWLTDERLLSCRRLVVRLMRHTTALNSGSHCPQAVRCGQP